MPDAERTDASPGVYVVAPPWGETPELAQRPVQTARARFPWNGYRTGSPHVPLDAPVRDHPLRPRFAWDDQLAATRYELQVDDSCERSAYRSCELPSPEAVLVTAESDVNLEEPLPVSMEAPVGRRYYWRVRACDEEECAGWSEVRYLDVGRAPDDYDGDGYSDVAVFASSVSSDYGLDGEVRRVQVWRGGPEGPVPDRVYGLDMEAELRPEFVGPLGDVNGDGFDDLFVLLFRRTAFGDLIAQPATIGYGGPAGPFAGEAEILPAPDDPSMGPGWPDYVAWARAMGDLDADGFDDVLLPLGNYVLYGSAGGLSSEWELPMPIEWGRARYLEPIDWNGDGYLDLAGVGFLDLPEQFVLWRRGAPDLRSAATLVTTQLLGSPLSPGARLRRVDDMDRDGFAELVGGDDSTDLHVLWGQREFPATIGEERFDWVTGLVWARFSSGDVDGDGFADLTIRRFYAPDEAVAVFRGNAERRPALLADCRMRDPYARVVVPSSLRDFDADGYADQLWFARVTDEASPRPDWRVVLFRGGPSGLPWSPTREVYAYPPPSMFLRWEVGGPDDRRY